MGRLRLPRFRLPHGLAFRHLRAIQTGQISRSSGTYTCSYSQINTQYDADGVDRPTLLFMQIFSNSNGNSNQYYYNAFNGYSYAWNYHGSNGQTVSDLTVLVTSCGSQGDICSAAEIQAICDTQGAQ